MKLAASLLGGVLLLLAGTIQVASYLPFDFEWALIPTAVIFAAAFPVAAAEAYVTAGSLIRIGQWPQRLLRWLRIGGAIWFVYTLVWFLILLSLPGVPTHCGAVGSPPCGHEYVFNNHGSLTVTDHDHFVAGVRVLARVFTAPPIAVLVLLLTAAGVSVLDGGHHGRNDRVAKRW